MCQAAPQGCLKSISLTIKTSFCAPDEFLVHSGDVVQNIFYLSSGSMEVVQEGMVVALLGTTATPHNSTECCITMNTARRGTLHEWILAG